MRTTRRGSCDERRGPRDAARRDRRHTVHVLRGRPARDGLPGRDDRRRPARGRSAHDPADRPPRRRARPLLRDGGLLGVRGPRRGTDGPRLPGTRSPRASGRDAASTPIMIDTDLAIVGAGPAGLAAAGEALALGLGVTLLDDNPTPGGQYFRQPPAV